MPTRRLTAAALLLLLLACAGARAQDARPLDEAYGRDVLRGLDAARVRVEVVPADLPGVTAELVKQGVVERLSAAGLRVLTGDEANGAPVLVYRVTLFLTTCGYTGTVEMQLREAVRVARAQGAEATAVTWQHYGRIHFDPNSAARLVRGLPSFVNVFVEERRAANGR